MEKTRSAKGQRLIKSFFRRVARDPKSSPDLAFRATEWLANIERGILERPLVQKDIRPVPATAPPLDVEHIPAEGDAELESLLKQIRGPNRVEQPIPSLEGSNDRGSSDLPGL